MATQTASRAREFFDEKMKTEIVTSILSKQTTVTAVLSKYKLQRYQLLSWIGAYAVENWPQDRPAAAGTDDAVTSATGSHRLLLEDPDLARMIGTWVLKNRAGFP